MPQFHLLTWKDRDARKSVVRVEVRKHVAFSGHRTVTTPDSWAKPGQADGLRLLLKMCLGWGWVGRVWGCKRRGGFTKKQHAVSFNISVRQRSLHVWLLLFITASHCSPILGICAFSINYKSKHMQSLFSPKADSNQHETSQSNKL